MVALYSPFPPHLLQVEVILSVVVPLPLHELQVVLIEPLPLHELQFSFSFLVTFPEPLQSEHLLRFTKLGFVTFPVPLQVAHLDCVLFPEASVLYVTPYPAQLWQFCSW